MPGDDNIVPFTDLTRHVHKICSDVVTSEDGGVLEVALQHKEIYYNTITAFHGGYDNLNVSVSSDGGRCADAIFTIGRNVVQIGNNNNNNNNNYRIYKAPYIIKIPITFKTENRNKHR